MFLRHRAATPSALQAVALPAATPSSLHTYGNSADVILTLPHFPSPTLLLLLLLLLCLWPSPHCRPASAVCHRGSISSRHSGRKRRQDRGRSSARFYAPCGRVWKGKLDRTVFCSHRRSFTALTPPNLPPLLLLLLQTPPSCSALLVWMLDCGVDGAEQARLIERLAARGGICGAAERAKPLSAGATLLRPVSVNGLRSIRDSLQLL